MTNTASFLLRRCCLAVVLPLAATGLAAESVFPGTDWETRTPSAVGLDGAKLQALGGLAGGRGCVVRHGYLVHRWGDYKKTADVASACKPFFAHFLFKALEDGKVPRLDEKVIRWEPRLGDINRTLGHKDRDIEWRHFAYQTSCYQVQDEPGTAFCYNDWQMALFWDTLFGKVYGVSGKDVNEKVFRPLLVGPLQCQDGPIDRGGRVSISPRDFCRFGLLYLHRGNWSGQRLLREDYAVKAVSSPLPADFPRAGTQIAEMIPGQRTIGSKSEPDNQCDHEGSYSYCWWVNGLNRDGQRLWPGVPEDAYGAFGHGGIRAMVVIPSLDVIVSWNETQLRGWSKVGQGLELIVGANLGKVADETLEIDR